jgi:hypothetical protein
MTNEQINKRIQKILQECIDEVSSKDCSDAEMGRYVWPSRWTLLNAKLYDFKIKQEKEDVSNIR